MSDTQDCPTIRQVLDFAYKTLFAIRESNSNHSDSRQIAGAAKVTIQALLQDQYKLVLFATKHSDMWHTELTFVNRRLYFSDIAEMVIHQWLVRKMTSTPLGLWYSLSEEQKNRV